MQPRTLKLGVLKYGLAFLSSKIEEGYTHEQDFYSNRVTVPSTVSLMWLMRNICEHEDAREETRALPAVLARGMPVWRKMYDPQGEFFPNVLVAHNLLGVLVLDGNFR